MNETLHCLELRRALSIDPHTRNVRIDTHLEECASCRAYVARRQHTQRVLRDAVRVPVPENLGNRILMSQSFLTRHERTRTRRLWLAAAASVLLVVGVLGLVLLPQIRQASLERELLALVRAADYALENQRALDADSVTRALAPMGYRVTPAIGAVSFAGRCLVRGSLAGHLVIREREAPVTVFLVPHLEIDGRPTFGNREWSGLILPSSGTGAIVVLGSPGADLAPVAQRVPQARHDAV